MQKLRMLDSGPNRNYRKNQIVEVDDKRAELLLAGEHATKDLAVEKKREGVTDGDAKRAREL